MKKLYHGSPKEFNVGDFIDAKFSESNYKGYELIYATYNIDEATFTYGLKNDMSGYRLKIAKNLIYSDFITQYIIFSEPKGFVYELDKNGFKERRDWMVSDGKALILDKIVITPQHISALCDTYKVKGAGIFKKGREIILRYYAHKIFDKQIPVKNSKDEIKWEKILSRYAEKI
jgi:hypothetical protein